MAFVKDKTGSAQTAANAAATVVAAFAEQFGSFKEAVEAYDDLRGAIFEDLAEIVDADNKAFAAADSGSSNGSSKSSNRSSKTNGGSKSRGGGGGGSKVTLADALKLELSWGAFEGETLKHVLGLSAEECESDYDYGDGERDGRDYIAWLAGDKNKNEYVQRRAQLIADDEGIDY